MIRLIINNKPGENYFIQFWHLKYFLPLSWFECFRILSLLRKNRCILIQINKDEKKQNDLIQYFYYTSSKHFDIEIKHLKWGKFETLIDATSFQSYIIDYSQVIRIYVSRQ